jgi:aryl-alcohol dehydrogenase-like predicted oxidoreductase
MTSVDDINTGPLVSDPLEFAGRVGLPVERLAVAWAFRKAAVDTVLVGARSTAHLGNAVAALGTALRPEWLAEIDQWE